MWSDPSPSMLYSIQSIHKFFMCVLIETRSKSSLCPWRLKKLRTKFLNKSYPSFRFYRSNRSASHDALFYSPTIVHDLHYTVRGWHMSWEGEWSGARSSQIFGRTVFHRIHKYPSPLPHFIYSARSLLSHSSSSNPSAAATPSSPVRKCFAASTSSPSYSRRPRKSSLRRRHSCLPLPS